MKDRTDHRVEREAVVDERTAHSVDLAAAAVTALAFQVVERAAVARPTTFHEVPTAFEMEARVPSVFQMVERA